MFRKTGLGQQLEIIPGPNGAPAADSVAPRDPRGAHVNPERRLQELLDEANLDPNGWHPAPTAPTRQGR